MTRKIKRDNRNKRQLGPISPNNDRFMVKNGLRPGHFAIDRSVFSKTKDEKERLKRLKRRAKQ